MQISVIIPAFNEEKSLRPIVEKIDAYLRRHYSEFEIIVVNDGSTDKTLKIAGRLRRRFPQLSIINLERNQGKGAAIKAGLKKAQGRLCLFLDADGAVSIEHLALVPEKIRAGACLVIGSRNPHDAASAELIVRQPRYKEFLGKIGNRLIRSLAAADIRDTQCGFKAIACDAKEKILPHLLAQRWLFDVELILLCQKFGLPVGIIPVKWRNGQTSRVKKIDYLKSFFELLAIRRRIGRLPTNRQDIK